MELETWFKKQYVTEVQTRFSLSRHKLDRLAMIYTWRTRPDVSMWAALPGENPPSKWAGPPSVSVLQEEACAAWVRCDRHKALELYEMWHHSCSDPYYCPMHGVGSD
jgi:hypothetical protein